MGGTLPHEHTDGERQATISISAEDTARCENLLNSAVNRVCCVQGDAARVGSGGSAGHTDSASSVNAVARRSGGWRAGGEFVVAAAEVLDEGMPAGDHFSGSAADESLHRPWPRLQPSVIALDRVVGVLLGECAAAGTRSRSPACTRRPWRSPRPAPAWRRARVKNRAGGGGVPMFGSSPAPGLQRLRSAAVIAAGDAFVQNLRVR